MLEKAIEVLEKIESKGWIAYIVGGFVRDYLLNITTSDIDICTNATPKDLMEIFHINIAPDNLYGSVVIIHKNIRFDITTFRKEIKYEDNRKPVKIKYINNIKKDLLRRDFTINTLCINSLGEVLDFLKIKNDLNKQIIKTVGNPRYKIKEDSLRILRAIRFSTTLNFNIEYKTKHFLKKYGYLLSNLSYQRKKDELDKIFLSVNRQKGIDLILELKLDKYLQIPNLKNIKPCDNIIGIWAQLDVDNIYPWTKLEKQQLKSIRELLDMDILNEYVIYKYGLYLTTIVADIKDISKKDLNMIRNNLVILSRKDLKINAMDISKILNKEPNKYIKEILDDVEKSVVLKKIDNDYNSIKLYILNKYSN